MDFPTGFATGLTKGPLPGIPGVCLLYGFTGKLKKTPENKILKKTFKNVRKTKNMKKKHKITTINSDTWKVQARPPLPRFQGRGEKYSH